MLSFENLSLQRGKKILLESTSLIIHNNEKIGLIGRNGTGKSSIFQLILKELEPTLGTLSLPKNFSIAHLAQETPALSLSAKDYVLDGDQEYRKLEQALLKETAPDKLGELQDRFEVIDGYRKPSLACNLLYGLGFKASDFERSVKSFSGGWRMRLNLAQCLIKPAALLLLDEPTNHLDIDAILFLERFLKKYSGTLLLISHDKSFLNSLCSTILHIENKKLNRYQGNYDDFERLRAEKLLLQQKLYDKQQKHISHMMKFVDKFKAKASKAKQAQSRVKAIAKIEQIAIAHIDSAIQFEFKQSKPCSSPVVDLQQVNIGYKQDEPLIKNINLNINYGERIALLGPNGIGKSTFLKVIADKLKPLSGQFDKSAYHLKVAYYEQHQLEQLVIEDSPIKHLQNNFPKETEQNLRNYLGQFGFQGDVVFDPIAPLSGGEKARLVLALLLFPAPNLLLLDEPTNHLDLEMRAALEIALQGYEGTLIMISHDRHLLASTIDQFYVLSDKQITAFDGCLDDYENFILEQKKSPEKTDNKNNKKRPDKKIINRIKKLENNIELLSKELKSIEQQLSLDHTYEDPQIMQQWLDKQQQTQQSIDDFENEWFELNESIS